jgi:hypothetical protein
LLGIILGWMENLTMPHCSQQARLTALASVVFVLFVGGWFFEIFAFNQFFHPDH